MSHQLLASMRRGVPRIGTSMVVARPPRTHHLACSLFHEPRRFFANRFPRRSTAPAATTPSRATAVATTSSNSLTTASLGASTTITGGEAQIANVRLSPQVGIKVDPSCIISVPLGVEVRPMYGAPQPIVQQQPAAPSGGGFLARLREKQTASTQQQAPADAVMLAEVLLQPGHAMPADSVQLGPVTSSRLHTLDLAEYGHEMYIARGAFLAGATTANLHNIAPSQIPGLQLQRLEGEGTVVVKIAGQVIEKNLAQGEQLFVQANRIVGVESTVQVLGGPNQLLTNVVGPGKVLLQSLPSLEAALVQQAEATSSALAASGAAPQSGMMSSPFGMGGMGGGLGSMVMQGAAFGVGSAIAHRAFDSAFGGSGSAGATPAAEAPPAEAPVDQDVGNGQEDGGDGSMFGGMFGGEEGGDDGDW